MKIGKLIFEKIRHEFPETSEGRLLCAVIEQALKDTHATKVVKYKKKSIVIDDVLLQMDAWGYLNGPMLHAKMAGVSPKWIKRIIKQIQDSPLC